MASHGDKPSSYIPALPYSDKRAFDHPRIMVPPPELDYESGKPSFHVADIPPFEHRCSYGDPKFLKQLVSCYRLEMSHTMLSWKYESRRQAQPILPFLFLGPSSAARDQALIQQTGVTFLLAVRSAAAVKARPSFLDPGYFPTSTGLETSTFDLDTPYDLITNLRPTIKVMNDHLQRTCLKVPVTSIDDIRGKILVFCESGNERSTVLVAAYIMILYGVDAITAIQVIQSQRFCINVDDGMKRMLLDLETILRAERDVSIHNSPSQSGCVSTLFDTNKKLVTGKNLKRTIDQAYESMDDMQDTKDFEATTPRTGIAPFADIGLR